MEKKVDENATLMNGVETTGPARDDVPETFREFLYNKKNGTVMGRTGKSWFQVIFSNSKFNLLKKYFLNYF